MGKKQVSIFNAVKYSEKNLFGEKYIEFWDDKGSFHRELKYNIASIVEVDCDKIFKGSPTPEPRKPSGRMLTEPSGPSSYSPPIENKTKYSDAAVTEAVGLIEGSIQNNIFSEISVDRNYVRIDELVWVNLKYNHKSNMIKALSIYFEQKGSTGRVKVLSDSSDRELGSYSVWSGIKVNL